MEDIARTLHRRLNEIECFNCAGAGLELETDGSVHCKFCGAQNAMAGPVCPRCEHVNAAGETVCAACRMALQRTCPRCQARNWSGAERCANCEQPLDVLGALIDRSGDAGERFHSQRRELADVAAREEESARARRAYLEAIDRRRQQAIAEAAARKAREQQIAITLTLAVAGLVALVLIAVVLYALVTR